MQNSEVSAPPVDQPKPKRVTVDSNDETYDYKKSRTSNLFKRSNGAYYGRVMTFGRRRVKSFGRVSLEETQEELRKWLSEQQGWNYEPGGGNPLRPQVNQKTNQNGKAT